MQDNVNVLAVGKSSGVCNKTRLIISSLNKLCRRHGILDRGDICWTVNINHAVSTTLALICDLPDLDLWPLAFKLVRIIIREVDNIPTNFGVYGLFVLDTS